GSYVPDGSEVIDLVLSAADGSVAFYDIDTPVTLHHVSQATCKYLRKDQIPEFDCYFSFTGGQVLTELVAKYQARQARPLYCSVDLERYKPLAVKRRWDLGYLGTYSEDRQKTLE